MADTPAPKNVPRKANRRGSARLAAVQALYQMDIAGTGVNDILAEFESHWIGREVEGNQYLPAEAAFFRDVVGGVVREAVIAACLTAALILVFLGNWRSTCIIAVSIPLAVLTSLIALAALGQTINIMTLGGLALAVGILVDDATVAIENITHHLENGESLHDAAISECVSGCTNPLHLKDRMGPRVLAVRESRYKLVLHFEPAQENLYDLEADPGEHSPLSVATQKSVRSRLLDIARQHLLQSMGQRDWRSRMQARLRELRLEWKKPTDKAAPVAC